MSFRAVTSYVLLTAFLVQGCSVGEDRCPADNPGTSGIPVLIFNQQAYIVSSDSNDAPDYLCDGTQDQVEINQAISAAAKNTNKRTVLLKAGTYTVDSSIILNHNVFLKGEGTDVTIIRLVDNAPTFVNNAGIIRMRSKSGRVTNVRIEDFTIDGNESHQEAGDYKKYGIYAEGDYLVMRNVVARNCAGYGFDPHSAKSHTIAASNLTIVNCLSENNRTDGFTLDMVQNSLISNNIARNNGRHGFNLCTTAAYNLLIGNIVVSNTGNGIMIQNGSHTISLMRNLFLCNGEAGMVIRSSRDCSVENNGFSFNGRYGMDVRDLKNTVLSGNALTNNGTAKPYRYAQIFLQDHLAGRSMSNLIALNLFLVSFTNARAAVEENTNSDFNRICSNTTSGFSVPFIIAGPNTICVDNW